MNTVLLNTVHLNHASLNGVGERLRASAGGGGGEVIPPEEPDVPDVPVTYILSASASNGVVSASVNGNAVTLPYTANEGDVVIVEVTANDGYEFEGWSDGSTDNPRTITMTADVTLSATCVEQVVESKYIEFADPAVEAVLMANNVSSDGVGITKEDAAAVTSIETWFKDNTSIVTFDEFKYFTGLTTLLGLSLFNMNKCTSIEFPTSITTIDSRACEASAFNIDICLPNLTGTLGISAFGKSAITGVISLGTITSMLGGDWAGDRLRGAFWQCLNLKFINFPSTLTTIGACCWSWCDNLEVIICNSIEPPTLQANRLWEKASGATIPIRAIYVPDESVDVYKAADYWSQKADFIVGISTLSSSDTEIYNKVKDYLV